jgi:flagellar biosynthesis protein
MSNTDNDHAAPKPRAAAVALGYDGSADAVPRLLAKGYGDLAERIVERAQQAGLYVHRSPEMVSLLMQVNLDAQVPPALYQAVAELLAWIYQIEHATSASAATDAAHDAHVPAGAPEPGPSARGFVALPRSDG